MAVSQNRAPVNQYSIFFALLHNYWMPMYDKEVRVGYISTILDSHGGGQLNIIRLRAWQYPTTGHQFTSILFFHTIILDAHVHVRQRS